MTFQKGNKYGGRPREDFDQRFFAKVHITSGCWIWTGALESTGYGRIREPGVGKKWMAHRVAYERIVGPIPEDLTLDHLCRNRACVRPDHLEPCTRGENTLRGETITAANRAKTHCPNGHDYDGEVSRSDGRRWRICSRCQNQASRKYYAKRAKDPAFRAMNAARVRAAYRRQKELVDV